MADNLPLSENLSTKNGNFICGVVEGFYGRPWTTEQRKDLFQKMKSWGMDSYVYAPKDDYKHRAYWRDLYTVEEAEHLTSLITSAHAHNITFYYALSPGLDITYSSAKELLALRRKLEQVSRFGCVAFALLFDDIESEMSEADKEVFQSFAHAQVSVSNEVYRYLGEPRFLVCPTQYCATRAVPTVTTSEYLNTLGSKLAPEIDIMWTGPKVISRQLTTDSIQEISDVLRRNPVIWDNLHANDYDQRRVFLGPYAGRSPHLHRKLRGVLTNPNCEYGANFVAIHTLAQWARCSVDGQREQNDSVSADIKLETETEDGLSGEDVPTGEMAPNMYHPRVALRNAIRDWLPEFERHKAAWGPIVKPQPAITVVPVPIIPSINTCMSLATTTTTTNTAANSILPATTTTTTTLVNTNQLQHLAEVCSTVCLPGAGIDTTTTPQPPLAPLPVMNSLVSSTKVICNDSIPNPITTVPIPVQIPPEIVTTAAVESVTSDSAGNQQMAPQGATTITILNGAILKPSSAEKAGDGTITADEMGKCKRDESMNEVSLSSAILEEPMDCNNSTPGISPAHVITTKVGEDDIQMTDNSTSSCSGMNIESEIGSQMQFESSAEIRKNALTFEDLQLLCDLFYLPFEHGAQGLQILEEFNWLKTNAHHVIAANQTGEDTKPEVQEWFARAEKLNEMTQSVNKLLEHLTVSNNRELVYDLYAYVWDIRGVISLLNSYIKWLGFSKGWKETFMSGEQEPWVFRGGLTADLQRLIPVDSGNDLFVYKAPDMPTSIVYTIRPYRPGDETSVYSIVCRDRRITDSNESVDKSPYRDLRGDMLVGPYLSLYPQFAMVVEDDDGIVGYACAVPDHKDFLTRRDVGWLPEMRLKYPLLPSTDESQPSSQLQDYVASLHTTTADGELPPPVTAIGNSHPSSMTCGLLSVITDQSVSKRLVTCLLAALRANGSFGVHVIVDSTDTNSHGLYGKLGFTENQHESIEGKIIMVRTF